MFRLNGVRHLPIVRGERVVGIFTVTDALNALIEIARSSQK
ncbi:MAG: CBS domain-containing protein [Pseudobdellovibrionaceae bacterium]